MTAGPPLVAVLGAGGAVGAAATTVLQDLAVRAPLRLRVGARTADRARRAAAVAGQGAEGRAVDATDPRSLAEFAEGCTLLLNCAGPATRLQQTVVRAAAAAGVHLVDAADGSGAMAGRCAVFGAGLSPGLTGLLPRQLLGPSPAPGTRLTGYVGGLDHFTRSAALDYVAGLSASAEGAPLAGWRDGRRVERALEPLSDVRLPYFPRRVVARPFLSGETERLARTARLAAVDWYSVFDGPQVLAALARLQPGAGPGELDAAADAVSAAAEIDLFGRDAYQLLLLRCEGPAGSRELVLRAPGASELTGALAAVAAVEVLAGRVPTGPHRAAEVLDPDTVTAVLAALPGISVRESADEESTATAPPVAAEQVEEGRV
ncbi:MULTISPECIES: saccharopine dehydrogenase NADP-binding domain-containing protein [unclassified Streptomyces]|uniref:saccharopine dehydrogenase NADP-binding domain-containing protein n=1 Tax=unclassified Streptomyces TaxID=2593676 RepID=UPI00036C5351|nr:MULTISPECIES: saccharopine dehydrogenase NADP-binding domain-containing protein [unclassified Streptomyces]MYT29248.1 saccharopine dehydrogenase [Streptomyces sp. SID8354]